MAACWSVQKHFSSECRGFTRGALAKSNIRHGRICVVRIAPLKVICHIVKKIEGITTRTRWTLEARSLPKVRVTSVILTLHAALLISVPKSSRYFWRNLREMRVTSLFNTVQLCRCTSQRNHRVVLQMGVLSQKQGNWRLPKCTHLSVCRHSTNNSVQLDRLSDGKRGGGHTAVVALHAIKLSPFWSFVTLHEHRSYMTLWKTWTNVTTAGTTSTATSLSSVESEELSARSARFNTLSFFFI